MAPRKPRGKKKLAWHQTINWRRWGWLAFKLGLVLFAGLLVTGIYLDSLIRDKFDGQKWQLPALVYSRPLSSIRASVCRRSRCCMSSNC